MWLCSFAFAQNLSQPYIRELFNILLTKSVMRIYDVPSLNAWTGSWTNNRVEVPVIWDANTSMWCHWNMKLVSAVRPINGGDPEVQWPCSKCCVWSKASPCSTEDFDFSFLFQWFNHYTRLALILIIISIVKLTEHKCTLHHLLPRKAIIVSMDWIIIIVWTILFYTTCVDQDHSNLPTAGSSERLGGWLTVSYSVQSDEVSSHLHFRGWLGLHFWNCALSTYILGPLY